MTPKPLDKKAIDVDDPTVSPSLHVADVATKPAWYYVWEHHRPEWLHESVAEFLGVFFYCYAGFGATAAMSLGQFTNQPFLGNLFTVGFAYAMGITFAITLFAMSSGGHFNPAVTIAFAVWKGFPWRKVPRYIACQISGAFTATLLVYGQYRPYIKDMEAELIALGKEADIFSPVGPAGIFAVYPNPGVHLGWTFMNEFFVDFYIGLVIWGALDPANIFVSMSSVPITIAVVYGTMAWSFAPAVVATNPARDFGSRLGVTAIWGTRAWIGHYPLIGALTAIPATLLSATVYELFLGDTSRVVTRASREMIANDDRHKEHKAWKYNLEVNRRQHEVSVVSFNNPTHEHRETAKSSV